MQDPNDQNQPVNQTPSVSVGGTVGEPMSSVPVKEHAPIASSEHIRPTEHEPQLPQEVADAGVEVVSHHKPPSDNMHIRVTGDVTPVNMNPIGTVQPMMSQTQAQLVAKKTKSVKKSILWLATIILRQFQRQQETEEHKGEA